MTHPFKSIDPENFLPKVIRTPVLNSESAMLNNLEVIGYNECLKDIQALGVELQVEELAKFLMNEFDDDYNWEENHNDAKRKHTWWIGIAKVIANNPKVLKIVKVKG